MSTEERQATLARRIVWLDGSRSWFAFLAAVLPPDEAIVYGTKGARERLARLGIGG